MDNIQLFYQIFNLSHQSSFWDQLMIFGAQYLIFVTFILTLVFVFIGKTREKKSILLAVLGLIIAAIIVKIIRLFYFEPRPFITLPITPLVLHEADAAFPSVHTTIMAIIAASYTFSRSKYALLFIIFMFWVGLARVFVGVHYPFDILGGIAVGFISTYFAGFVINYLRKKLL